VPRRASPTVPRRSCQTLGVMQRFAQLPFIVLTVALLSAVDSSSAKGVLPLPPSLEGVTSIRVTVTNCGSEPSKQLKFEDQGLVQRLASEMERLRKPSGIEAGKFSCDVAVNFFKADQRVALVHVFPCAAWERAPVSGKRYFQYPGGLRQLPELQQLVGNLGRREECR